VFTFAESGKSSAGYICIMLFKPMQNSIHFSLDISYYTGIVTLVPCRL